MLEWLHGHDPSTTAIAAGCLLVFMSLVAFIWAARRNRGPSEVVARALRELNKHAAPSPLTPGRERGTFELPEHAQLRPGDRVRVLIRANNGQRSFDVPHYSLGELEDSARRLGYVVMYRGDSSTPQWDLWTTG